MITMRRSADNYQIRIKLSNDKSWLQIYNNLSVFIISIQPRRDRDLKWIAGMMITLSNNINAFISVFQAVRNVEGLGFWAYCHNYLYLSSYLLYSTLASTRLLFFSPSLGVATTSIAIILPLSCIACFTRYHRPSSLVLSNCGHVIFDIRKDFNAWRVRRF